MARKLRFERVLDAPALFSVAYGEIASSLYFALGIVAGYALGLTPVVLLGAGVFFLLVSLSYAEGTAAIPETGGAATFVRRAFNDLLGFLTGWVLFLDYLIVIALSAHLPAALPRRGARARLAARLARRRRRGRAPDRRDRRRPARAEVAAALGSARRGGARSRDPAPARPARPRARVLARRAHERRRRRCRAHVGRPRVRAAARAARVHRPRDGGEPRRGDPRAGSHAAPEPVFRDRARGRDHGPDRGGRSLGLPGRERHDCSRRGVAARAARRHRLRARPALGPGGRAARLRRAHGRARPVHGRDDLDVGLHPARALARRARAAAARVRPPEPADTRLAAGDPRCRDDLDRARDRQLAR